MRLEQTESYAEKYHLVRRTIPGTVAYENYWNEKLLTLLPPESTLPVLDLMCGEGIFLPVLAQRYDRVLGIDLSFAMLSLVDTAFRDRIVCGDALQLPFSSRSFGAVVVRGGLHHLPNSLSLVLSEARRVMKPQGQLVILEPCDDNVLIRGFRRLVYRWSSHFDQEQERGLTTEEITAALVCNGFRVVESQRSGFVGYALLLNTDASSLLMKLNTVPGFWAVARLLIAIDAFWERIPILRRLTFNVFTKAESVDPG